MSASTPATTPAQPAEDAGDDMTLAVVPNPDMAQLGWTVLIGQRQGAPTAAVHFVIDADVAYVAALWAQSQSDAAEFLSRWVPTLQDAGITRILTLGIWPAWSAFGFQPHPELPVSVLDIDATIRAALAQFSPQRS